MNGAVRLLGDGYPRLLSARDLDMKWKAIKMLVNHWVHGHRDGCHDDIADHIRYAAVKHKVPVSLAMAVAKSESEFRPHRISRAGAMGVMQLMPGTALEMGVVDPFNARQNVDGGVRYLAKLWKRYKGDAKRAVAAYNAGPGAVPLHGNFSMPQETRQYIQNVTHHLKRAKH